MKDIVFVDTSVFIQEHYFQNNNRINTLVQLHVAGLLDFISTDITINEIHGHFINDIKSIYSSLLNDNSGLQKKGVELSLNIDSEFDICKHCSDIFDKYISRTSTYIIPYSELTDIKPIFDKYFQEAPPFHSGKKKNEFPDAFVLGLLDAYCEHKGLPKIIVLAADKDFANYASTYLDYKDYKQYVTEKSAEQDILSNIKQLLNNKKDEYRSIIEEDLSEALNDEAIYYNILQSTEINDIEIDSIDLDLKTDDFSIISQTDEYYILEVPLEISFVVDVEYIDYSYATYDKEDNQWYNEELAHFKAQNYKKMPILFTYHKADNKQGPNIVMDDYDIEDAIEGME